MMLLLAAQAPVPRDIGLPLPVDRFDLTVFIVILLMAHLLFVNLMMGASLLSAWYEFHAWRRNDPDLRALARRVASTITVNKSVAVVLGVGPLLVISLLYTEHFYWANTLTGTAWISLVPLIIAAFLLGYLHRYTWDRWADRPGRHLAVGALTALLFLCVPLIFLVNINLMLFPARWGEASGFFSMLFVANVWPRYLHFLLASLAVTGLFLVAYVKWFPGAQEFAAAGETPETLRRPHLVRRFYWIALFATMLQLLAGPLVFFTLPVGATGPRLWSALFDTTISIDYVTLHLTGVILAGIGVALIAIMLMTMEVTGPIERGGRYWAPVVGLLGLTVILMLQGRHMYREEATREHRQQMADASRAFAAESAYMATADDPLMDLPLGERTFRRQCATCHAMDERLTGPPMLELSEIYRDRGKRQLIDWVKQPGRERKDYPAMPAITLTEEQYGAVADYVLGLGAQAEEEAAPEDGSSKEDGTLPAETPAE